MASQHDAVKYVKKGINKLGEAFGFGGGGRRSDNEFRAVDPTGHIADQQRRADWAANLGTAGYLGRGRDIDQSMRDLRDVAQGRQSYSAEQLRQALQQNQSAQASMAAGARPANAAMAARTAAMQSARLGSGLAGQQALAGIAERQAANQALGNLALGARGQDVQWGLGQSGLGLAAAQGNEQARTSRFGAMMGVPTQAEQNRQMLMGGLSLAALASDRRLKEHVKAGDDDASAFLTSLKAHTYRYKDEKWGHGKQLGIMAQDLEKTPLGKQAVIDTPHGKIVHGGKLAGALAAASATLHKRLARLEAKSK